MADEIMTRRQIHDDDDDDDDDDEYLFKPIPQQVECPICFLPLPVGKANTNYNACCWNFNFICCGCTEKNSQVTK